MSTYKVVIVSSLAQADAFEYMARFSNAARWDPGVLGAEELEPGPPRLGSRYLLIVSVLGRRVPLEYRIEDFDPPKRVVFQAQHAMIRSTDVIEVSTAADGGSTVTYSATLSLRGTALLLAPLMGLILRRTGDRAAAGLRTALARGAV